MALAQKLYTPARTAPRNPYPQCHKFSKTLPLVAQNLGWNLYPYWHKSTKKYQKVVYWYNCWCTRENFGQFSAIFYILHSPWHKNWENHTLYGTHLVFKTLPLVAPCLKNHTLCGTEIGQNGTLAVLAYAYCNQWECPPPPGNFLCTDTMALTVTLYTPKQFYLFFSASFDFFVGGYNIIITHCLTLIFPTIVGMTWSVSSNKNMLNESDPGPTPLTCIRETIFSRMSHFILTKFHEINGGHLLKTCVYRWFLWNSV